MKEFSKTISGFLKDVFGYGMVVCLFAGGLTFFGYLVALIMGGETATSICVFIYKTICPIIVTLSNVMIIVGLLAMYLNGEKALTISDDKKKKEQYKNKN